jgi:hypothetical protein
LVAQFSNLSIISYSCRILLDHLEHLLLDEFFFQDQPIFVPNEVWLLWVDIVFLHATLKKTDDIAIIGVLGEA